jgi:hypothetical protein
MVTWSIWFRGRPPFRSLFVVVGFFVFLLYTITLTLLRRARMANNADAVHFGAGRVGAQPGDEFEPNVPV